MASENTDQKAGRIVWHDLFTADRNMSKTFYERLAGWKYITEHATEFAWDGGESDFVLALLSGEAGAGMIDRDPEGVDGWLPYVEVAEVDAAAAQAVAQGGTIVKPPFEVPGVGRNCLLRDPCGAYVGISLSRHEFPVPTKQFGVETYLSRSGEFPAAFYRRLFGWSETPTHGRRASPHPITLSGDVVAALATDDHAPAGPRWVPSIRVATVAGALGDVQSLGGTVLAPPSSEPECYDRALVADPTGALCYIVAGQP